MTTAQTPQPWQAFRVDVADGIADVQITGPGKGNAMGPDFWRECPAVFRALDVDDSVRVVIVRGAGRCFSFGLDLLAMAGELGPLLQQGAGVRERERLLDVIGEMQAGPDAVFRCRKPVIAAIHSWCLGGAIDLVSACDVRLASQSAMLSVREVKVAMVADVGTLQRLPHIIGEGHARELAMTGKDIDAAHANAKTRGARIVHCCGFDSIPSDLGTRFMQERAIADGGPCDLVRFTLVAISGGFSGGTAHSLLGVVEAAAADPLARKVLKDPYSLVPDGPRGPDRGDAFAVSFDDDVKGWVGPFVMGSINTRVVRRSNHLLAQRYGDAFSYLEQQRFGSGVKGRLLAHGVQLGLGAVVAAAASGPGRALLGTVFPAPGTGPSEQSRDNGFFTAHLHGRRTSDGAHYKAIVAGHKDPGYAGTAIMLSQSALCLAKDDLDSPGGVTTPAAAMGLTLVARLQAQGMGFSVERLT